MKVIIVEDETAAAVNLQALLRHAAPEAEVLETIETIEESVEWFRSHPAPDLVFMDIHLADGEAFRIFDRTEIPCPIIFTTAYDQYALAAFKVNSIDYLLKPISETELRRALDKLRRLTAAEKDAYRAQISQMTESRETGRPTSFLIHIKDRLQPLGIGEIAYFYTCDEKVTAHTLDGRTLPMDKTLEALGSILPDNLFFRANRQFIVSRSAIQDISVWFGSRLSVNLTVEIPEKVIISKARVPEFKRWLTRQGE